MEISGKNQMLPLPTVQRYPLYLRSINEKLAKGVKTVSSALLAEELGLDPVLARKDLAMVGIPGKPRLGYPAEDLARAISEVLGWESASCAVLVGVGSLGRALLGYGGFREQQLSICAAFDSSPAIVGASVHGITVEDVSALEKRVREEKIGLGILTVPNSAAQECADRLVRGGISGIWNFTTVQLAVPENVIVEHIDLSRSLAVLSHKIKVC